MPLVEHSGLPSFESLKKRGQEVLSLEQANHQDIRELHIGILNMMPDAALTITEEQFINLVGGSNQIAQFYVHLFTLDSLERSAESRDYIHKYYDTFADIRKEGLDALIITGANISNPEIQKEPFWDELNDVISWADRQVTSVLCSCLATHALVKYFYNIDRQRLPGKRWGVYPHRVSRGQHPLLRDLNTRFDVPHSRYNEIRSCDLKDAGLKVLVESEAGDVHLAVSPDCFRYVFLQGHPEYSINSLLKEYKREVKRYIDGERGDYPPLPENYFTVQARRLSENFGKKVMSDRQKPGLMDEFPETELEDLLDNTWGDSGKTLFNNWLGLVYKLTHVDRKKQFIEGVDRNDPLGMKQDGECRG